MSDVTIGGVPGQAPGGVESNESTSSTVITPPTTGTTGALVYCTLPLQLGQPAQAYNQSVSRIDWKQFQTSPMLVLQLLDASSTPMNLTGSTIMLRLAPVFGGGTVIREPMTPQYANGGLVGYVFLAADVVSAGTFNLEVEEICADGTFRYYPMAGSVLFVINPSLGGP